LGSPAKAESEAFLNVTLNLNQVQEKKFYPKFPVVPVEEIQALRGKLDLSAQETAKLLRISVKDWVRFEAGDKMPAHMVLLLRIAAKNGALFILRHY
jgi:DNA-binding transcriptional regulator YiaG